VSGNVVYQTGGNETIVGTVTGNNSASLTITFNADATEASINDILQGLEVDYDTNVLGGRTITTSAETADGLDVIVNSDDTDTQSTKTLVGDFGGATGVGDNAEIAVGTAAAPVALGAILDVNDVANAITLSQNTYIVIDGTNYSATAAQDIQAQIDAGYLIVGDDVDVVRVVTSADADITSVGNLSALGGTVVLYEAADAVTMTTAQALAFGTVDVAGTVAITDLETNLAADLSNITAGTFTAALVTADADDDVTFTGSLGSAEVTVAGGGDLTAAVSVLDGANVTMNAGTLILSDPENLDGADLSGLGAVAVTFSQNTILADASTDLGSAFLTVDENTTLTVSGAIIDGLTVNATPATTFADTGSSVVVTDLAGAEDLASISAGGDGGQVGASAGTLTTTISEDLTFTGDFGSFVVTVAEGATLTVANAAIDQHVVRGAGSVVVNAEAGADLRLGDVTAASVEVAYAADADISGDLVDFGTASVSVAAAAAGGATLTLVALQADGATIAGADAAAAGETGGSVAVTLDAEAAYDLSGISAGTDGDVELAFAGSAVATIDASGDITLDVDTDLGTLDLVVESNDVLTLSAAQADGRVITDAAVASLIIDGLTSATDLAGVTFDGGGSVTATASTDIDLTDASFGALSQIEFDDGGLADADENPVVSNFVVTMTAVQNSADDIAFITGDGSNDTFGFIVTAVDDADLDEVVGADTADTESTALIWTTFGNAAQLSVFAAFNQNDEDMVSDNQLAGTQLQDYIEGGLGDDTLDGRAGNDVIVGGFGQDTLTGGTGDDLFVFNFDTFDGSNDSVIGSEDVITDFEGAGLPGGDLIAIYDPAGGPGGLASFIGSNAYTGDVYEIRVSEIDGDSYVMADMDGDLSTDIMIIVQGVTGLSSDDFLTSFPA
jgi:hypothetical protein